MDGQSEMNESEEDDYRPPRKRLAMTGTWTPPKVPFNFQKWRWDFGANSTSNNKVEQFILLIPTSFSYMPEGQI
jgi:hypothetical protein